MYITCNSKHMQNFLIRLILGTTLIVLLNDKSSIHFPKLQAIIKQSEGKTIYGEKTIFRDEMKSIC
jgi:hypothetical protein